MQNIRLWALRPTVALFNRIFCNDENVLYLQAKEKSLEQILPSQPAEGINPAGILTLDLKSRW